MNLIPLERSRMRPFEEITGESYGPLKALCEKAVQDTYGEARVDHPPRLDRWSE